jgi:hypothetical protein
MSEPSFNKLSDLKYGVRNKEFLAFPGFLKDTMTFCIQCESKENKRNSGFAMVDEHIIKTFCHFTEIKIDQILTQFEAS